MCQLVAKIVLYPIAASRAIPTGKIHWVQPGLSSFPPEVDAHDFGPLSTVPFLSAWKYEYVDKLIKL